MPTYTIETPSQRKLKIEAADEATALRGAREWEGQNAGYKPQPQGAGKVRIQLGDRLIEIDDSFLKMSPADQQSTVDEIEAALDGMQPPAQVKPAAKSDLPEGVDPTPPPERSPGRTAGLTARALGRGLGADLLGAPGDAREFAGFLGTKAANAVGGAVNFVSPVFEQLLSLVGTDIDIPDVPDLPPEAIGEAIKKTPIVGGPGATVHSVCEYCR